MPRYILKETTDIKNRSFSRAQGRQLDLKYPMLRKLKVKSNPTAVRSQQFFIHPMILFVVPNYCNWTGRQIAKATYSTAQKSVYSLLEMQFSHSKLKMFKFRDTEFENRRSRVEDRESRNEEFGNITDLELVIHLSKKEQ